LKSHVHPDLRPFLDFLPLLDLEQNSLAEIRNSTDMGAFGVSADESELVTVSTQTVPGLPGNPAVEVYVYRPASRSGLSPAILHVHGGGFIMGSPLIMDATNRKLAVELGCVIVSVVYRLAPETVFPGAIQDCYAALAWLSGNAESLGVDRTRIGVKGESAGGGLAAALALMARDRGEFALAFQNLMAPMIDDRTCLRTDVSPYLGEIVWTPDHNRFGWAALLGQAPGGAGVSPYAAPARAVDVSGLPPTFISVGSLDLFLEENLAYAGRLAAAGVPVELHVFPGAFHGFDLIPEVPIAADARQAGQESMRKSFSASALT
jgi:acetyl esterase/lipase